MTRTINGVEYEIVWNGGEGLTSISDMKSLEAWVPPPRLYNKTGRHVKKVQTQDEPEPKDTDICEQCGGFVGKCKTFGHIQIIDVINGD